METTADPRALGRRGLVAAALVWTAALVIWRVLHLHPRASLVAYGVALDLTITASLAAYLFSRQSRLALGIASLGFALAMLTVAPARPLAALIEPLLLLLTIARLPAARRTYAARRAAGDEPHAALAASLSAALNNRVLGHAFATELALVGLALTGWLKTPPPGFYPTRKQWRVVLPLLSFLVLVESTATHILIAHWSRPAALIVSLLSAYSLVWLLGDYQALRLLPTTIGDGVLTVRLGLRLSARIPLASITAVERVDSLPPEALRATIMGAPSLVIRAEGIATTLFARRRPFSAIALALEGDQSAQLMSLLSTMTSSNQTSDTPSAGLP